jgi:hypothetical protein
MAGAPRRGHRRDGEVGEALRPLYLEERVAIARQALNERTMEFADMLPAAEHTRFNQLVRDLIDVLDGDRFGEARERLAKS